MSWLASGVVQPGFQLIFQEGEFAVLLEIARDPALFQSVPAPSGKIVLR
jgi:hypothetical protein